MSSELSVGTNSFIRATHPVYLQHASHSHGGRIRTNLHFQTEHELD